MVESWFMCWSNREIYGRKLTYMLIK